MNPKIKIFQATGGKKSISGLEDTINKWLNDHQNNIKIVDKQMSAVSLADDIAEGEMQHGLIVCIWFIES